ncbi:MAG: hypothetical protein JNM84_10650 [Planctomycetes bacterium]|nr:hypothetical protein [Planctomycetota bacterium]
MNLAGDLLEQALHLARRERRRPKQVSLRRSVSAAYYALFHFLVERACDLLVSPSRRPRLHAYLGRAFHHETMAQVCRSFASSRPAPSWRMASEGSDGALLVEIGRAFVDLQQVRHEADYDRGRSFVRQEAIDAAYLAEQAMRHFERVQGTPEGDAFLAALLVQKISRA